MAKPSTPPLVVLDTNLVLSALVFSQGRLAWLRLAWQQGRCVPLASTTSATELMRALAFPKFKLSADDQQQLLGDYLPHCRTVRMPARMPSLPQCRDGNDQMSIELAAVGKADFLVTGDKNLLVMAPDFKRRIITAEAFQNRLP